MHIRKALSPSQKVEATTARDVENENKVDEDDRILNEMEEMAHAIQRKSKRAKKLIAKRRAKVCSLPLSLKLVLFSSDLKTVERSL